MSGNVFHGACVHASVEADGEKVGKGTKPKMEKGRGPAAVGFVIGEEVAQH